MAKSPDFRVYYSDGSTCDGYHDAVEKVPIFEVLLIVERNKDHGRKIVSNGDYYVYDDRRWLSCDLETKNMYMERPVKEKRYLIGVMVHSDKWDDAVRRARSDPDFPPQTALSAYETKDGF